MFWFSLLSEVGILMRVLEVLVIYKLGEFWEGFL